MPDPDPDPDTYHVDLVEDALAKATHLVREAGIYADRSLSLDISNIENLLIRVRKDNRRLGDVKPT